MVKNHPLFIDQFQPFFLYFLLKSHQLLVVEIRIDSFAWCSATKCSVSPATATAAQVNEPRAARAVGVPNEVRDRARQETGAPTGDP
ncbi:hypothetical protein EVAR_89461_1 [Eumeta japonica]|uniref:Uncharacterized protein n=1 Tax=Eumeta variegata TaxID=151549 RepID=A0A4C1ZPZ0_EUMVA|nr:hypothetical protein EVAR_89461_1 [Eumeta japonica]